MSLTKAQRTRRRHGAVAVTDRGTLVKRPEMVTAMRRIQADRRSRGEWVGPVPFGWRAEGGTLIEDKAQQVVIRRIVAMRQQVPPVAWRAIAEAINGILSFESCRQVYEREHERVLGIINAEK